MKRWKQLQGHSVRGLVKRIQNWSISVGGGSSSGTATLLAVDVANTVLVFQGQGSASGTLDANVMVYRVELTNSTTVTATKGAADAADTINGCVIEYWPGVLRSVQRGTQTGDGTVTLATPVSDKAYAVLLGKSGSGSQGNSFGTLVLTPPTTLAVSTTNTGTVSWQVVDPN